MTPQTSHGTVTRRGFVKGGGALFVSLGLPGLLSAQTDKEPTSLDASRLASWIEIRSDDSILVRTGRGEIGTGMSAFYPQTVAEELSVRPETIALIMADTDRTPDGGYSSGFLTGAANLRKVAAYTYQALLALAAAQLGVPAAALIVTNGVVSGGGKSISYGQLVQGQHLELTIPISGRLARMDSSVNWGVAGLDGLVVTGDPPLKPIGQYRVVGTSYPMPGIANMVTGRTRWTCDVTLPGLLHARMVRPATLGSTLISVGALDKNRFPTAEVVRKGNLLAVVSPDEWEATMAARSVAAATKWTAWAGLPGSENATKTIRAHNWAGPDGRRGNSADVTAAFASAPKTIVATYEQAYVKHAPIGPFVAVAHVRHDGTATVWSHSSQSQGLRARVAHMLGSPVEKVVIRWLEHAGQYGRTTFGGDGAEADAVILSQLTGKPVRVQWTLQEDMAWSSVVPAWVSDIKGAIDATGHLTAVESAFYAPHTFDARPVGAILAGMPTGTSTPGSWVATEWPYDRIQARFERTYGMPNLGAESANGGLRGNIMRTPAQRQQNFALEGLINEAAAAAGVDPIEYRLRHATDQRLIDILKATAEAAGWQPRPSPHSNARKSGADPVTGRGVAIIVRDNGYWVGIAEIAVTPATGEVRATKFTIGLECGKIINPRQLDRCMKGGVVMGLSEALKEEMTFDRSGVTSIDWSRYKILTMEETPEIQVVQISRNDKGFGTGGEAANAVSPAALVAAFFDATGVQPRRIPLTAAYVKALLKG
jgi:nicotinate dehydrogenase subunit B